MRLNHTTRTVRPPRAAFTALELIIVLLVMGILSAAAVPKFIDSLRYHSAQSAARRLKGDLEHLRQTARLTSKTQTLIFDGTTYGTDIEEPSEFHGLDGVHTAYRVDLGAAPFEIDSLSMSEEFDNVVSFDPYGMPAVAGELLLQAGPHESRVMVNSIGEIEILE